ncbi:MAG TPA: hypothetical protein VFW87_12690, partial [Pirellulales bacterium]|nr:hypothetical protein [Pirellulales bacterium]
GGVAAAQSRQRTERRGASLLATKLLHLPDKLAGVECATSELALRVGADAELKFGPLLAEPGDGSAPASFAILAGD